MASPPNDPTHYEPSFNLDPPPLGIQPYYLWVESVNFSPSLEQLLERYIAVSQAVSRYITAKKKVPKQWYRELGSKRKSY